jgi:hypothetical protein
MRRCLLPIVVAVAALVCHPTTVFALRFTSTFEPIRVELKPGETQTRSFTLTLARDERTTRFRAKIEDWWSSEDGRQSFYRPVGTVARTCGRWITINPVEATVQSGGTLEIRVSVSVPRDAKPGGYWCVLTTDEISTPARAGGVGMQFLASISVGVFVDVLPVTKSIRIAEVRLTSDEGAVRVQNTGNAPVVVEGRFEFLRPNTTKPVAATDLPRTTLVLDPAPTRLIAAKLPSVSKLPSGRYLVRAILDIGLDHYIGAQKEMDVRRETAGDKRR